MKTNFIKIRTDFGYMNQYQIDKNFLKEDFYLSDFLDSAFSLGYKAWFIHQNCDFTISEYREFDIGCALSVLPIYELKYPEHIVLREALEEAQVCLKNDGIGSEILKSRVHSIYNTCNIIYDIAYKDRKATSFFFDVADFANAFQAASTQNDAEINENILNAAYFAVCGVAYYNWEISDIVSRCSVNAVRGNENYQQILLKYFREFCL